MQHDVTGKAPPSSNELCKVLQAFGSCVKMSDGAHFMSATIPGTLGDTSLSKGPFRAARGTQISCKGWQQEAALRMLMNNLDPEVAEKSAGIGGLRRHREGGAELGVLSCDRAIAERAGCGRDVAGAVGQARGDFSDARIRAAGAAVQFQSGGSLEQLGSLSRTRPRRADDVRANDRGQLDLHRHAGNFTGDVRNVCGGGDEAFRRQPGGKLVVTGGMGGMGGAQPLAATMNGAAFLGIDVDPERIKRRVKTGYCDVMVTNLDEALRILKNAVRKGEATSVGLVGNCADLIPEMARRGVVPDLLTDQTSAHDPIGGYVPNGMTLEAALELRKRNPEDYKKRSMAAMAQHVQGMLDLQKLGSVTFDYGNNIRTFAFEQGVKNAYDFPGFVPAYIRPLFCEGKGPFRWAALSGEASDIARADRLVLEMFPQNEHLARWIKLAQKRVKFQGLPSRICWLGYGERDKFGLALNDLVARGELKAPIVIGRDHLDCGSVASPYRETESMLDGSDAIADWPLLNALVNTASGASWVSIHNGGGVGIGYSQHAGQVTVADGTKEMAARIERVLTNDPGMGVVRHVDAGYSEATEFARKSGVKIPML